MKAAHLAVMAALASGAAFSSAYAQQQRQPPPIDQERARQLYVSKDPQDHAPNRDFARDVEARLAIEKR